MVTLRVTQSHCQSSLIPIYLLSFNSSNAPTSKQLSKPKTVPFDQVKQKSEVFANATGAVEKSCSILRESIYIGAEACSPNYAR